jgi:hypothetical protein
MASYYPEGECFFVRSSLKYSSGEWTAENADQFYSHILLEYQWNGWTAANTTSRYYVRIRIPIRICRFNVLAGGILDPYFSQASELVMTHASETGTDSGWVKPGT